MTARARSTPAPARRTAGRPTGAAGDQRDALLDAATSEFARLGFAGASLRAIATRAHVTPALASYYFGDKAGLLEAVIERRVAPLAAGLQQALERTDHAPLARLRAFVEAYTLTAARNPWLPQLIVREVLSESGVLRETFARRFASGVTGRLRDAIALAQERGELRPDLEPAALVMSLFSLCVFPFIATPLVTGALGIVVDEQRAPALAAHHWSLFLHGAKEDE